MTNPRGYTGLSAPKTKGPHLGREKEAREASQGWVCHALCLLSDAWERNLSKVSRK